MSDTVQILSINPFLSVTIALLVYILGAQLTLRSRLLRDFNIPEPVSGGLAMALFTMGLFLFFDRAVEFNLQARDYFLLVFFSGIGLNARLSDLTAGGKPLAIMLGLTCLFILLQNVVAVGVGAVSGLPGEFSVLLGSASLIGGHGTVIAWSPRVAEMTDVSGAEELGIAVATLGLVAAALIGGPIAKYLIGRNDLQAEHGDEDRVMGVGFDDGEKSAITHLSLMRVMLWVHITIMAGYALSEPLKAIGLDLPTFVPCLLAGIVIGNLAPILLPRLIEVRRTPTLAMMSDFALGLFLAMSLMSLQLWALAGLGKTLVLTLAAQTILTVAFCIFVVFPAMGRNYFASVMSAGFGGFGLGATPTAIANMTAVTKRYGPSPLAFVVLPLISAFFVDIANSFAIQFFLSF